MRYPKRKLLLFFAVQALGVALMIRLLPRGWTSIDGCESRSAAEVIVPVLVIVGEMGLVAVALRSDARVWHALLGLGATCVVGAFVSVLAVSTCGPNQGAIVLVVWHLGVGGLLLVIGVLAAMADLLERWRRSDEPLPEDQKSSGLWPFD